MAAERRTASKSMNIELVLTPNGHLRPSETDGNTHDKPHGWLKRVNDAFRSSQAEGLFALGATKPETPPPPSFTYWRELANRYLTDLSRTPDGPDRHMNPIDPPDQAEMATLLLAAPPMQGAEYLTAEVLQHLWGDLDTWVRQKVASSGDTLGAWLKNHAPMWHQVGRVCFHLAENKRDPECPFAFLATYAPRLSQAGRVQHQASQQSPARVRR